MNYLDEAVTKSLDEFMEYYKVVDTEEIYSNGIEFVPIFRVKQWEEYNNKDKEIERLNNKIDELEKELIDVTKFKNSILDDLEKRTLEVNKLRDKLKIIKGEKNERRITRI